MSHNSLEEPDAQDNYLLTGRWPAHLPMGALGVRYSVLDRSSSAAAL
jgi:hypothetical protein